MSTNEWTQRTNGHSDVYVCPFRWILALKAWQYITYMWSSYAARGSISDGVTTVSGGTSALRDRGLAFRRLRQSAPPSTTNNDRSNSCNKNIARRRNENVTRAGRSAWSSDEKFAAGSWYSFKVHGLRASRYTIDDASIFQPFYRNGTLRRSAPALTSISLPPALLNCDSLSLSLLSNPGLKLICFLAAAIC